MAETSEILTADFSASIISQFRKKEKDYHHRQDRNFQVLGTGSPDRRRNLTCVLTNMIEEEMKKRENGEKEKRRKWEEILKLRVTCYIHSKDKHRVLL